jgi:N-acyl-phosphatidylethanolamine-hydrolysing phospholipase D
MKKIYSILFFTIFLNFYSCEFIAVITNNTERLLFRNPLPVANKIKDPIRPGVRLSALWVGHATVLLQIEDKVIMTDPFLTKTSGEFLMRIREPGVDIENIPELDMIIISHSHMDHLHLGSLHMLEKRFPGADLVFPAGVEKFIPKYDFKFHRIDNDDGFKNGFIGESRIINGIKITSVYALHWGGRYLVDGFYWADKRLFRIHYRIQGHYGFLCRRYGL